MGKYRVTWNRSAYQQMVGVAVWYRENVALKAGTSFISSVSKTTIRIVTIHCNLMNKN